MGCKGFRHEVAGSTRLLGRSGGDPIPRQPRVDATPSKAQRPNHHLRTFAGLDPLHCANPNLFQRLMIQSTSVTVLHALLYPYVVLLMTWLITAGDTARQQLLVEFLILEQSKYGYPEVRHQLIGKLRP